MTYRSDYMQKYEHILFQKNWRLEEETIFRLGQSESIIEAISSAPIKPEYRKQLLSVSLRKGARATTAIEGNTLSEEEVARIDAGEKLPPSKEYLEIEVGTAHTTPSTTDKAEGGDRESQRFALSCAELIERFNYFVSKDLGEHFRVFRPVPSCGGTVPCVGAYRPPPGADVAPLMIRFCEWISERSATRRETQYFSIQVVPGDRGPCLPGHDPPLWGRQRPHGPADRILHYSTGRPAGYSSHISANHCNETQQDAPGSSTAASGSGICPGSSRGTPSSDSGTA